MYQISCDDLILHDTRLSDEYRLIEPVCELELNTAGHLSFYILPTHPYYDRVKKLSSVITLTQDGEVVFSGRVLNDEKDFNNIKRIEVEGELSYLGDSNQRQEEVHNISVKGYFTNIIEKHNSAVEKKKQFKVGEVTVEDPNDSLYRISNYENTLNTIKDRLIDRLGGYIRIRHVKDIKYIDYIKDYENVNTQVINFGTNLLNLKEYIKGENIVTAIIPLGAKISDDSEKRIGIESVNGGNDYVYDEEAVKEYGWIFSNEVWDNVNLPENLKRKAENALAQRRLLSFKLELTAIDLHLLDVKIERIKLGDKIRVISKPHDIDRYMQISKLFLNITKPENNTISLGFTDKALTDITNKDINKQVIQVFKEEGIQSDIDRIKYELKQSESELSKTAEQILLQVSSNYVTKNDYVANNEKLSTQFAIYNDRAELKFDTFQSKVEEIEGSISSNQSLLEEYIRFKGALIELGKVGNIFVAKLSNERLSFLQSNVEVAYISNNKLYITDGEIRNKLTIGNPTNGYFDFIPRRNGNLSMKWRKI